MLGLFRGKPNFRARRRSGAPLRVIVFFGHHKVGSSALQTYLASVAPAALREGVLYPVVTPHDLDAFRKSARSGKSPRKMSRNVTEAHNALAFSMLSGHTGAPIPQLHPNLPSTDEMFALIRRQIGEFAPHTLVLASEVFANFAHANPVLIDELFDGLHLDKASDRIELFAYLRRVDDYLASWHAQRVRFGHRVRPLPGAALNHYFGTIHFDYRRMIEAWLEALPAAKLVLRPYDGNVRKAGSVATFAKAVGLDLPSLADPGKREVNLGLHRGVLELARAANGSLDAGEAHAVFRALLNIGPALALPPNGDIELFGTAARAELFARFAPIHDWLSARYGQPFFEDFEKIGALCPIEELDANTIALAAIRAEHMKAFTPAGASFIEGFEPKRNYPALDGSGTDG